jgi:hypothetical protein
MSQKLLVIVFVSMFLSIVFAQTFAQSETAEISPTSRYDKQNNNAIQSNTAILAEVEWDDLDSHKWIAESWANEISANWTEFAGRQVLQADITFNNENWAFIRTDSFPSENWEGFLGLRADVYQIGGPPNSKIKLEVRGPAFDPPIQSISCTSIRANTWKTCEWLFNTTSYDFSDVSNLSMVFDDIYGTSPTFHIDDLRLFTSSGEEEWDNLDDESRWWFYFGNWDNWNTGAEFGLEPISHNVTTQTTPAGAAYLKWDYAAGIGTTAEIGTRGPDEKLPVGTGDDTLDEDWSDVTQISADIFITDPNVPISIHIWDEDEDLGFLVDSQPAGEANSWVTLTWDVFWPADFNRENVDEVKFAVNEIDVHTNGEMYIDNIKLHKTSGDEPGSGWTTMVFLNGDNDLDGWTASVFNRLEQAVYHDTSLIVYVLWDRSQDGDTNLYRVLPDIDLLSISDDYIEGESKWTQGELDMGDPATLLDFIIGVREKEFTEYSWLSIVDHGGGWSPNLAVDQGRPRWAIGGSGFSWDFTNNYSYLSTSEMGIVFSHPELTETPIDVVFYDACLMGMIEEAYEIRHGANFFVASENETWSSFPYFDYLESIQDRTPEEQAIWIVDKYDASLSNYPRTMSVIDLQQVDQLNAILNLLAGQLTEGFPLNTTKIENAFQSTQKFDYDYDLLITDTDGYVDLGDLAKNLAIEFVGTSVEDTANDLLNVLEDPLGDNPIIIAETHESGYSVWAQSYITLDNATGLSIYLPFGEEDEIEFCFYNEDELAWAEDTYWNEFIREYRLLQDPTFCPQPPGDDEPGGRDGKPKPLGPDRLFLPIIVNP